MKKKITAPAFAYHSLGILQNCTNIPLSSISLSFSSNFFHKSWFATGLPVVVVHPFLRHSKIHSEMPLTAYSESYANLILENPSPAQAGFLVNNGSGATDILSGACFKEMSQERIQFLTL